MNGSLIRDIGPRLRIFGHSRRLPAELDRADSIAACHQLKGAGEARSKVRRARCKQAHLLSCGGRNLLANVRAKRTCGNEAALQ